MRDLARSLPRPLLWAVAAVLQRSSNHLRIKHFVRISAFTSFLSCRSAISSAQAATSDAPPAANCDPMQRPFFGRAGLPSTMRILLLTSMDMAFQTMSNRSQWDVLFLLSENSCLIFFRPFPLLQLFWLLILNASPAVIVSSCLRIRNTPMLGFCSSTP